MGLLNIHDAVQPSSPSLSKNFIIPNRNSIPSKQSLSIPLLPAPGDLYSIFCYSDLPVAAISGKRSHTVSVLFHLA